MTKSNHPLIVIAGPTASGKSALAVKIALRLNSGQAKKFGIKGAEIISADSRQVYKGLDIGSGKITKKEMAGVPHHLLDVASPKKTFTVVQYQKLALKKIKEIWRRGKLPILCGGTGFYIQAVIDGLVIPEVKANWRLRKELENKTAQELFRLLKNKDPRRAKEIDRRNKRRLIRALEIVETLGKIPKIKTKPLKADVLFIGISKTKIELKKAIERRIKDWLKRGLLEEIITLKKMGLADKRIKEFGLVYNWALWLSRGQLTIKDFTAGLTRALLQYSKRQMTWFSAKGGSASGGKRDKRIQWIENEREALKLADEFLKEFG